MYLSVSSYIGLRYSRSQSRSGFVSFVTFFSIAGILLGVASLITVVSVMNGFEGELKKRILGIVPHIEIASQTEQLENWKVLREGLLENPNIDHVTPFLANEVLIQSANELKGVWLHGIIPKFEQQNIIAEHIISGSLSDLLPNQYGIVIGASLARKLDVNLKDKLRVILPNKLLFTPMGRVPMQRTFVIQAIFNVGSQVDDSVVYIHLNDASKLNRMSGEQVNQLRVYLHDAFSAKQTVESIKLDPDKYKVTLWTESQGALFSAVKMEKNMMWLMLSLIIAVAAFNIISALVMGVIDKQGEIGILQTLGMNKSQILSVFITQGVVNGVWGVVLGSSLGLMFTFNINEILNFLGVNILGGGYNQQLPVIVNGGDILFIVVGALSLSFIASLYPAYRASQTLPAEVLRNE